MQLGHSCRAPTLFDPKTVNQCFDGDDECVEEHASRDGHALLFVNADGLRETHDIVDGNPMIAPVPKTTRKRLLYLCMAFDTLIRRSYVSAVPIHLPMPQVLQQNISSGQLLVCASSDSIGLRARAARDGDSHDDESFGSKADINGDLRG